MRDSHFLGLQIELPVVIIFYPIKVYWTDNSCILHFTINIPIKHRCMPSSMVNWLSINWCLLKRAYRIIINKNSCFSIVQVVVTRCRTIPMGIITDSSGCVILRIRSLQIVSSSLEMEESSLLLSDIVITDNRIVIRVTIIGINHNMFIHSN